MPRDAVDAAVAACGVGERRHGGKLPAHVVAYLTMGLCLFRDEEVAGQKRREGARRWSYKSRRLASAVMPQAAMTMLLDDSGEQVLMIWRHRF